jgi:spore maturation protein CgeB
MVGAAFVGQKFKYGESPYSMVRHGVDGMLASTRSEWYSAMKSLVESKDLREQLAGAAKERILKEYDYKERAQEWAEVFRWAAEHPNYGLRKKED